jgi:general secretion pathway protein D
MKFTSACAVGLAVLLPSSVLWIHAEDPTQPIVSSTLAQSTTTTTTTTTGISSAEAETAKRHQLMISARQAIGDGDRLLSDEKYDEAADRFQYALDALNNGGVGERLYNSAQAGLAQAKAGQARDLAKDAKFAQAATLLEQAINLQPQNPEYPRDLEDLKKEQIAYEKQVNDVEGTVHNPAVTDEFRDRVATVQKLLFQGDDYAGTGQFDKAEETYSKILILDPYNKAARAKMDHIERLKYRAASFRHEEYEDEALLKVNQDWSEAISTDIVVPPTTETTVSTPSERADITRKLQSIVLPSVDFDKLDIAQVIDFLTKKSKELDPDHVGINFVLRLTSDTPPPSTAGTPTGATPAPNASGAAPAAGATPDAAAAAAAESKQINRQVSITLQNVPLADILGYIVQQTNLQYSVEDYAVYLRPSIDEGETLTVRTFLAPANFFSGAALSVDNSSVESDPNAPVNVAVISRNAQPELENRGIHFPAGATATFLPGSSKLVVRNTPEQLDLIANIIENLSKESPQVQIESKLAEFNQDSIKGITFNYQFGTPGGLGSSIGGTTALRNSFSTSTGAANAGLTPDGIDTLIAANDATTTGTAGAVFPIPGDVLVTSGAPTEVEVGAVLDGVGFAAVLDAINNSTGVSLVSAPSVTTQNGLKANIDIVREFPYPTSFEKPKLSDTEVEYTDPTSPDSFQPLVLAVPPTPREFQTQDVGVSLEVKPTTYPDQRIDLDITKAQVIDFEGFIDYGVPIVAKLGEDDNPSILTPGTINQPVFNLRSVVTNLQVLDGQTAVLGGLINESTQEINDKVPILGDIPVVGRLFQSKVSERTKKNLIIFVTAHLIRSNGAPQYIKTLNAEPEEESLPEPPPLGNGPTLPSVPESEPNS